MRGTAIAVLLLMIAAIPRAIAQDTSTPRILIQIPTNAASDSVWIRYLLIGAGDIGDTIKVKPNVEQYVIYRRPDQRAKIVVYAPGCQFKAYSLGRPGTADVSLPFVCDPLPTRTLHGLLPVAQIPAPMFAGEKELAIVGELNAGWICDFFLQQPRGTSITFAGSCLSSPIPLGTVGKLDPTRGGQFQITIPDFSRDPLFIGTAEVPRLGRFGVIELGVSDQISGRILAGIKPENSGPEQGLDVQSHYADPVLFTRVR